MKRFAELCADLERTSRPQVMRGMLDVYAATESTETTTRAMALITGSLSLRVIRPRDLATLIAAHMAFPPWLIDTSRILGGTLAETSVLLLPRTDVHCERSLVDVIDLLSTLQQRGVQQRNDGVLSLLLECSVWERIVLARILVGSRPSRCELPQETESAETIAEHRMITTLLYAHTAPGIGQQFYSHFTVGVKKGEIYVPLAKIPNTLEADVSTIVENLARQRTVEKFGPTHWVSVGIIVEIAYTEIVPSTRTKSGIKLHGARLVDWLPNHAVVDVDTIE